MDQIVQSEDHTGARGRPVMPQAFLEAENVSLRLLLAQAEIDAKSLLAQAGLEAMERDTSDKLRQLILEELHHRIKNTLATVSAIASQSLRGVPEAVHARQAIEGRLVALGRAHDLLLQERWASADLAKIIRGAVEAFENPEKANFHVSGPVVRIGPGAVIAIAMSINELCTNATKFGALSVPDGRIDIAWTVHGSPQWLRFVWTEINGPVVSVPTDRSFGSRLIETLGKQLNGDVRLTYEPGGLAYSLDVPLASLASVA